MVPEPTAIPDGPSARYGILVVVKSYRRLLIAIILLIPAIACRAATRLLTGDGPGWTANATASPSAAAGLLQPTSDISCPDETGSIVRAASTEMPPSSEFPAVDTGSQLDIPLVAYTVNEDQLSAPLLEQAPRNLLKYQRDFPTQRSAWKLFTTLIPRDQRGMLVQFKIMTDGPGGVLSSVEQSADDPRTWILEADIADIPDTRNLTFTLLHEFGHLLTLSPAQVPPDLQVFNDPDSTRVYDRAVAACPNYFPGEGCSAAGSYINMFFDRFWTDLYAEWNVIDRIGNDDRRQARLDSFYRKYRARFVDSYAVTSPTEDIAETWTYYLLDPKPSGSSVADQKISFFYGFPELVKLREQILGNLCSVQP